MIISKNQLFSSITRKILFAITATILSGCTEDYNYINYAGAAAAGAAAATAGGYMLRSKKPVKKIITKSKRVIPAQPARTIEVIEEVVE